MAWTTPRTWVAGELVTAAIMNTHVRDNLNMLDGALTEKGGNFLKFWTFITGLQFLNSTSTGTNSYTPPTGQFPAGVIDAVFCDVAPGGSLFYSIDAYCTGITNAQPPTISFSATSRAGTLNGTVNVSVLIIGH